MPALARTFAFLVLLVVSGSTQHVTSRQLSQIRPSVFKVEADGCSSGSRSATGFHWQQADLVVTAWHVVSDCNQIQVYSETVRKSYPAHVVKVLMSRDLALLKLSQPAENLYEIKQAQTAPDIDEDLTVLGYPLTIPSLQSKSLRAAFGGRRLRDAVPTAVTRTLQSSGYLSPDTEILNIDGHLLPGHSGAPILNGAGELVAVADGGLSGGTVGISWALPVSYLSDLLRSNETPNNTQRTQSAYLFAAEIQASRGGPQVTCHGFQFQMIRSIGFSDLMRSTDDPLGLGRILNVTGPELGGFRFDVYQELSTGASFVVPSGATVQQQGDACLVVSPSQRVWFLIGIDRYASLPQLEQIVANYERFTMAYPGWQYDPGWSYAVPMNRFDGFGVRRKSFVHFVQAPTGQIMTDAKQFETLATRNGVLLAVSALNRQWYPNLVFDGERACAMAPGAPLCTAYLEWAQAVISVHLATFPVG